MGEMLNLIWSFHESLSINALMKLKLVADLRVYFLRP